MAMLRKNAENEEYPLPSFLQYYGGIAKKRKEVDEIPIPEFLRQHDEKMETVEKETDYPWYDDRTVVETKKEKCDRGGDNMEKGIEKYLKKDLNEEMKTEYNTPQKIYEYLDQFVWRQEEAKKAAAILAYNTFFRDVKETAMFIGPTGCGKTYIWRCLKEIFPDRIEIVDGSNITMDGWKGEKKWSTLFSSTIFSPRKRTILVIDEADKMLAPRTASNNENIGREIAAEGLKIMEGIMLELKAGGRKVDTSKVSIVFCGAFSENAERVAEESNGITIGFGARAKEVKAYDRSMAEEDLISYGVLPEFVGRLQRLVNLEGMTEDDFYRMTGNEYGPQVRVGQEYNVQIGLSDEMRRELAGYAHQSGLGVRGIENRIRQMLDDAIFENCERQCFEF